MTSQVFSSPISSFGNINTYNTKNQNLLTQEQKDVISSVLEKYDANSLSKSDAQEIVNAFKNAGINPSKELANEIKNNGFDAKEIRTLANTNEAIDKEKRTHRPPPPPPPPKLDDDEDEDTIAQLLASLLEETQEDSVSEINAENTQTKISKLNDKSKKEAINILSEYTVENKNLSKNESKNIASTLLNQILNNSENYKKQSLYA